MRAFFCLPIEARTAEAIERVGRAVRDATDLRASWVPAKNYHVTLRFLGEIDPQLTPQLEHIAHRVTRRIAPFPLVLDRLGGFPSADRVRVLWVGGDAPPTLQALASSLRHELSQLGFPREAPAGVAHVTLARVKGRAHLGLAGILSAVSLPARLEIRPDRLALMESDLTRAGAVYRPLVSSRFQRGGHDGD